MSNFDPWLVSSFSSSSSVFDCIIPPSLFTIGVVCLAPLSMTLDRGCGFDAMPLKVPNCVAGVEWSEKRCREREVNKIPIIPWVRRGMGGAFIRESLKTYLSPLLTCFYVNKLRVVDEWGE